MNAYAPASPMEQDTLPPNVNPEGEAALLGGMMMANGAIDTIAERLSPQDFSEPLHGRIYSAILAEHSSGRAATPITLRPYFADDPTMQEVGGLAYLAHLTGSGAAIVGIRDFAEQIRDLSRRRKLVTAMQEVIASSENWNVPIEQLVELADAGMTGALQRDQTTTSLTIAAAYDRTLQAIEDEAAGLGPQGIRIDGLEDFNQITGDLRRGELLYLGGRPSMGKTALALRIALGAAKNGHGTALVSLEMRVAELMTRAISDLLFEYGNSPTFDAVRRGRFSAFDWQRLKEARETIDAWPLVLTDPSSLNIGRLAMMIRRYQRSMAAKGQQLDLVIIDYLGLIKGLDRKAKRFEEVGEVSRILKQVAKECNVALVVLAQLNRECEKREDKRPMLSDLRDAGDIEQDADHVMFVYREEYYLERAEPDAHDEKKRAAWEVSMGHARDRMEIILAKARNGRVGKRTCYFFAQHQAVRGSTFMKDLER